MALPILDTSAGFVDGDEIRLMDALGIGISEANISGVITCMNQLSGLSVSSVLLVLAYLGRYDDAQTAKQTADLANTESKTLVKADVLAWEVSNSSLVGLNAEIATCRDGLLNLFSFCPYMDTNSGGYSGVTPLVRS